MRNKLRPSKVLQYMPYFILYRRQQQRKTFYTTQSSKATPSVTTPATPSTPASVDEKTSRSGRLIRPKKFVGESPGNSPPHLVSVSPFPVTSISGKVLQTLAGPIRKFWWKWSVANTALSYNQSLNQGILKGEVSLYRWPPVCLVWNQLHYNRPFLFLFAKQANLNRSNRRSMLQWYFPL